MAWPILRAAIDRLLASSNAKRALLFTGGEPLLGFSLIKRAVSYVERVSGDGRRIAYDISTNGTLMRRTHVRYFSDNGFKVQISFDGVAGAQAARGRGTFRRLDALLDLMAADAPELFQCRTGIAAMVSTDTLPWLADSIEYLLSKRVQEIILSPAMGPDISWRASDIEALDRQFARVFSLSLRHCRDSGEVPVVLFRKTAREAGRAARRGFVCSAPQGRKITVDVDGQVYACPMLAESFQVFPDIPLRQRLMAMRLGDIRDPGLDARIRALPKAAKKAEIFSCKESKYSSLGRCASCKFIDECTVCPVPVARDPKFTDPNRVPDHLCAYNQITLSYRARFPRQVSPLDVITGRASFASYLDPFAKSLRP